MLDKNFSKEKSPLSKRYFKDTTNSFCRFKSRYSAKIDVEAQQ